MKGNLTTNAVQERIAAVHAMAEMLTAAERARLMAGLPPSSERQKLDTVQRSIGLLAASDGR